MKQVIVLGGGLVGGPIALDLATDERFRVTVADVDRDVLARLKQKSPVLDVVRKDLSNPTDVTVLVEGFDLVVNAVPGFMGFQTAKAIIGAGKDCTCIAFYEEDPFQLDELCKEHGVTMVMDCGVYPGMGSALIMHVTRQMDEVDRILTFVGGLPQVREWPSEYKAVFSPIDVIEEYVRPARYVENGIEVVKPALSDPEYINFPGIGTLEAFNTDGLRTLVRTIDAPNMKEKTLRYPGHIEKMAVLRELGFFAKEETLDLSGRKVSPLELTAQVLFPNWQLKPGEGDITVFQSTIDGRKDNKPVRYVIDMQDRYCPETDIISMARTTGYTATLALRMIADGLYTHKGISPPEYMGRFAACMDYLQAGLRARGVNWNVTRDLPADEGQQS